MEIWIERQFFIPRGCLLHFDSNGNLIAFQEGCIITLVEDSENEEAAGFRPSTGIHLYTVPGSEKQGRKR